MKRIWLVGIVLLLVSCGGSDLTHDGSPVVNLPVALRKAEALFQKRVATDFGVAEDGASCFVEVSGPKRVIVDRVLCGPAYFPDSDAGEFWFPIAATTEWSAKDEAFEIVPDDDAAAMTVALPKSSSLVGVTDPAESTDLQVPLPPPEKQDYSRTDLVRPELGEPDHVLLRADSVTVGVGKAKFGATSKDPGGNVIAAPDGFEFVSVNLRSSESEGETSGLLGDGIVLVSEDNDVITADEGSLSGAGLSVTAVVKKGSNVDLRWPIGEVVQSVDLRSGKQVGLKPAVWYRDDAALVGIPEAKGLSYTTPSSTYLPDQVDEVRVAPDIARLMYTVALTGNDGKKRVVTASKPENALLVVNCKLVDRYDSAAGVNFPVDGFSVTVDGAKEARDAIDAMSTESYRVVVFEVPATVKSAVMTLRPGRYTYKDTSWSNEGTVTVDFKENEAQFRFEFSGDSSPTAYLGD